MKSTLEKFSAIRAEFPSSIRKTLELLKKDKKIEIRNKTCYKPLKHPIWGMKEGPAYIHRSPRRAKSKNYEKKFYEPISKSISPIHLPRKQVLVSENRVKTPIDNFFKIIVKNTVLNMQERTAKPKLISDQRKFFRIKRRNFYKNDSLEKEDFEELKAWNNDSVSVPYYN